MSGTITLTAAMRANLLSLQQTGTSLSTTQLDLATGNKVNSALDNPVNFFAAQSLNNRASQLSSLLDGMGQAVSAIQATNQGITSITTMVNQLTSITNSATQDLAKVTTVNTLETSSASGQPGITSDQVGGTTSIGSGASITLTAGSAAGTFAVATGETLQTLVNNINSTSGFSANIVYGDGVTMSAGQVSNAVAADPATSTLATPNTNVELAGMAYLNITSTNGQAIAATGDATTLTNLGLGSASVAVTTGSDSPDSTNFNNVLSQINALVTDSNYQGTNLINGNGPGANLTVQVNEVSTNPITINNVDLTTAGNSGTPGSVGLNLGTAGSVSLASTTDIANAVTSINAALATLQTTASGFANSLSLIQTRQDFTSNLVNTLQDGASQLTIADKNEEGANLLALQTQQQLGIEALSLSSQANQSVLRLFA